MVRRNERVERISGVASAEDCTWESIKKDEKD